MAGPALVRLRIRVPAMDCPEEIAIVRKALEPLPGVEGIVSDLSQHIATITVTPKGPTAAQVSAAIQAAGLEASPVEDDAPVAETWWALHGRALLTLGSGGLIAIGLAVHAAATGLRGAFSNEGMPLAAVVAYGLAIAASIIPLLPRAWHAVRSLRLDMNVLMVVAVGGAIALGDWFEAATVVTLFGLSLLLEGWTARRSLRAIGDLLGSRPVMARLRALGEVPEHSVPALEVLVGAVVIVKPGETIPVDGRIISGATTVDQAPITGESIPVAKTSGDGVFAGCVNGDGAIEIESTKPPGDSLIGRIARMVAEAQTSRGRSERWLDSFARFYTPAMLLAAIALALVPPLVTGQWAWWLNQALVLLVIACPCALVISVPVCIVAGIATAARHGVVVRGGAALEMAARIRAVAFDKTGTLTQGRPAVLKVKTVTATDEDAVVGMAATLESRSEHPLAKAVMTYAGTKGIRFDPMTDVRAVPGRGVESPLAGTWAGSVSWAQERGALTDDARVQLAELAMLGASILVVGRGASIAGFIACQDRMRPEAIPALAALRALGIARIIMLSGDSEQVAGRVAAELGIGEAHGGLLPDDKVKLVTGWAGRSAPLAMVGDGLNDAPALARADLGVAMGEGTAATIETADIALLTNDLRRLPWLVGHARQVMSVMRQNVIVSLVVKAAFILAAVAGHGSLWAAIAADTGMAVLVVLNALRLLRSPSALPEVLP
ncbi:MAG: cation-translocating P-type ATPase [Planctomycetes bacterium]|nr:cation-translocating P-type ATPase [Planctomycetota bacterium]